MGGLKNVNEGVLNFVGCLFFVYLVSQFDGYAPVPVTIGAIGAGFYIHGIVGSYRAAERYNKIQ